MILFQFGSAGIFQDLIYRLEYIGFTEIILPFTLIFTIFFALLQKINLFGKPAEKDGKGAIDSKKFNVIISLVMASLVVIPHVLGTYPAGTDVVQILNQALPGISLVIILIVLLMIVFGIITGSGDLGTGILKTLVTVGGLAAVLGIVGNAAGWWMSRGILSFLADSELQSIIVVLVVFWLIIAGVTKEPSANNDPAWKKFHNAMFGDGS